MKEILKNGRAVILKMLVTQLGFAMFGFFYAMASVNLGFGDGAVAGISVFTVLVYLFILFLHVWEHGAKDRIKIDGGRMKRNVFTGMILSLVANSVNIILAIFVNVGFYNLDGVGVIPLSEIVSPDWAVDMYRVSNMIARLIQAMYLGFIRVFCNEWPPIFFIIVLPAVGISFLGYYLGVSNRAVFFRKLFMQKNK